MPDVIDELPPTQCLIIEVLAARHRLGEHVWTFPNRTAPAAHQLAVAGLIEVLGCSEPGYYRARLTESGLAAALMDGWVNPVDAIQGLVVQLVRLYNKAARGWDFSPSPWPVEAGPEPVWYSGATYLADPALMAKLGLTQRT